MSKPKFETWVVDVISRLSGVLNLHEWRINVLFNQEDPDDIEGTTAWTNIDHRYLSSYIHFTDNAKNMWTEGRMIPLRECVVHEMVHILLNPLHDFAKQAASPLTTDHLTDILEQTTQKVTRIVIEQLPTKFFSC